jgi:hypothetical protein
MAETNEKASVKRITLFDGRTSTLLEQDSIRVLINDIGGMIPELSSPQGNGRVNPHWIPWFRGQSAGGYDKAGDFWQSKLLYHIAGSFPCFPNFGPDHRVEGMSMPAHGWTASELWQLKETGIHGESGAAWARSVMESPEPGMPLSFKKTDLIIPGHPVYYSAVSVTNKSPKDIEICAAWHNTVGSPFLQAGCRISGAASSWVTPPRGGEFDATTRLALGSEFASLEAAPLAQGGGVDLSLVPGPIGYTDFAAGVIPASARLGWSTVVNPALSMVYLSFFTGPGERGEDDIILTFNEFWMQYGGRPFSPWAPYEGATDYSYCLGAENAVAAFAYGLDYSRKQGSLLGAPVTETIPGGTTKTLRYGTLLASYEGSSLDGGVQSLEAGENGLILKGGSGKSRLLSADPGFKVLKTLE